MKRVTGTLIWYYYICKREVWLMSREINPFQDNVFIELGRLISEETYSREKKELTIESGKIDMIRRRNGMVVVCEVKKSSKFTKASKMQLLFYLWQLKKQGFEAGGELLVPKERKRVEVNLREEDEKELEKTVQEIKKIMEMERPPPVVMSRYCKVCAYNEFCNA